VIDVDKAVFAIDDLLQQLQSKSSGLKAGRPSAAAKYKAEAAGKEEYELCQLAQAVVLAITALRKSMPGKVGHTAAGGAAAAGQFP